MAEALCRLRKALGEQRVGPLPSFSLLHAIKALDLLARAGPLGRAALARRLGIGEGAVRTLLNRLIKHGLVRTTRQGCELAERGRELWGELSSHMAKMAELGGPALPPPYTHGFAILVKRAAGKVRLGIEQRDEAIRAGARGAITLVLEGGRLRMPGVSEDVSADYPGLYRAVAESLRPDEGDVVIIAYAEDLLAAEYGALAAALSLLEQ